MESTDRWITRWRALTRADFVAPTLVYGLAALLSQLAGFRMIMGWGRYQLLDRQVLAEQPLQALWLLHSQPPGLNALLAALLKIGALSGLPVEWVAGVFFFLAGWLTSCLLFWILRAVSASRTVAGLGVVILVSNPGFHYFSNDFFYPSLLQFLFALWAWLGLHYLRRGRAAALAGSTLALAGISLTRTLYPPTWAVFTFGTVLIGRARVAGRLDAKAATSCGLLLLALLAIWPGKNLAVFGQFLQSSWVGYNLTLRLPVTSPERTTLARYIQQGRYPAALESRFAEVVPDASPLQRRVLLAPEKADGSRNWNHLVFVETNRALVQLGLRWRLEHPARWLKRAVAYYAMWSRPTFVHSYDGDVRGPARACYQRYAALWASLCFADLRPIVEAVAPDLELNELARVAGRPVPYSLFGLIFPACLTAGAWTVMRRRRTPDAGVAMAGILLLVLLWSVAVPCLTDGVEGNRMRFATSPFLLVLLAQLGAAWRPGVGEPPQPGTVAAQDGDAAS